MTRTGAVDVHYPDSGGARSALVVGARPTFPAAKPLFVTAAGLSVTDAAAHVAAMAGPFRLPDALRRVDALARGRR
jgi:hypothetical protein